MYTHELGQIKSDNSWFGGLFKTAAKGWEIFEKREQAKRQAELERLRIQAEIEKARAGVMTGRPISSVSARAQQAQFIPVTGGDNWIIPVLGVAGIGLLFLLKRR